MNYYLSHQSILPIRQIELWAFGELHQNELKTEVKQSNLIASYSHKILGILPIELPEVASQSRYFV